MNQEQKTFYMNRNIRLFPTILALTWDVLLIWTISTLYFTTQKGLSYSQVIMLDSILMMFGCLFCIPVSKIFQKVGSVASSKILLVGYAAFLLICIYGTQYWHFVIAHAFLAFGYAVGSIKVNPILVNSLAVVNRQQDYQKIYGRGMAILYVLEAVGAVGVSFIYSFNPTLAIWFSVGFVVLCEILLCFVKEPEKFKDVQSTEQKQVSPDGYLKILKSSFFICLLVYIFFFRGIVSIASSSFKVYLQQITDHGTIQVWAFGIIFAGTKICAALSSKYQFKMDYHYGLKSLIIFCSLLILSFVVTGVVYVINPYSAISVVVIILFSYILGALRIPNQIFVNNYMQFCMPEKNIERAYAIRTTVEYLGYALMSFLYATLMSVFCDNYGLTNLVYIGITFIPLVVALIFFIRALTKRYAKKKTIIKKEYSDD